MTKREARKEQFRRLGAALSTFEQAWAIRKADYQYEIRPTPVCDPELNSPLYGPQMRTQQFASTVFIETT